MHPLSKRQLLAPQTEDVIQQTTFFFGMRQMSNVSGYLLFNFLFATYSLPFTDYKLHDMMLHATDWG